MQKETINVVIKESKEEFNDIITIPRLLLDTSFTHYEKKVGTLNIGFTNYDVKFIPTVDDTTIKMPKTLIENLGLYNGMTCNIRMENKTLHLGPVIGVFTTKRSIEWANNQITTKRTKQYIRANRIANCILYFFCIDDVDFINRKIKGTIYNTVLEKWEKKDLPLPDVLYDRGGSRTKHFRKISNYIRDQFDLLCGLKKINPVSHFDKLDLYNKLSKYDDINPHLPLTKPYSKKNLKVLFSHSKSVYIKACIGSNGRNIMKVEKISDTHYKYSTARNKLRYKKAESFEDLVKAINKFFSYRKLIVQASIDLQKVKKSITDMRATLQRQGDGEVTITTYAVRIAKGTSPVTSTASGSQVYSIDEYLRDVMHYSEEEISEKKLLIDEFLLRVYKRLEESYGIFGEMGIDFAFDNDSNLWFIESNAKPAKSTVHLLGNDNILLSSYLNPLAYAAYLASF